MYSDEELVKEGERIVQEFRPYSKLFVLKESFYHGTYGRCLRFSVETLEGISFRILFHRTGLTSLTTSEDFENFEQFFNEKSPAFREEFSKQLFERLNLVSQ